MALLRKGGNERVSGNSKPLNRRRLEKYPPHASHINLIYDANPTHIRKTFDQFTIVKFDNTSFLHHRQKVFPHESNTNLIFPPRKEHRKSTRNEMRKYLGKYRKT